MQLPGTRKPITERLLSSIEAAVVVHDAAIAAQQATMDAQSQLVAVTTPTYTASSPFNIGVGDIGTYTSCNITLGKIPTEVPFIPYFIKDVNGTAATKNIIVTADAADTIEGSASVTISTNYGSLSIMPATATKWVKR